MKVQVRVRLVVRSHLGAPLGVGLIHARNEPFRRCRPLTGEVNPRGMRSPERREKYQLVGFL